jgi:hypothetical protein
MDVVEKHPRFGENHSKRDEKHSNVKKLKILIVLF